MLEADLFNKQQYDDVLVLKMHSLLPGDSSNGVFRQVDFHNLPACVFELSFYAFDTVVFEKYLQMRSSLKVYTFICYALYRN